MDTDCNKSEEEAEDQEGENDQGSNFIDDNTFFNDQVQG